MKKLFLFALMCLMTVSMNAQRCAVMEFKAGAGISQADVDGISAIFITYFRPEGYTMVERTQIDRVIDEQGFQRSRLTESQMVRIGEILNVSKIVVGNVNIVMGQYNVDVRAINVESGTQAGWAGDSFSSSTYRATMQNIAQQLADQISIKPIREKRNSGMYVDLGLPSGTMWKRIDETGLFDYDSAIERFPNMLPTKDQYEELIALCQTEMINDGYKFTGPSGESIVFKGKGNDIKDCDGKYLFFRCAFLSSESCFNNSKNSYVLYFDLRDPYGSSLQITDLPKCIMTNVRLVQNP